MENKNGFSRLSEEDLSEVTGGIEILCGLEKSKKKLENMFKGEKAAVGKRASLFADKGILVSENRTICGGDDEETDKPQPDFSSISILA